MKVTLGSEWEMLFSSSTVTLYCRPSTVILNFRSIAISLVFRVTLRCARMGDSMRAVLGRTALGLPLNAVANRLNANDTMRPNNRRDSRRYGCNVSVLRVRQFLRTSSRRAMQDLR